MHFKLSSSSFGDGEGIPTRHTCDGADISPALQWSAAPSGTRSFALICADPDAPAGIWYHWAIFDIPPTTKGLPEHCSPRAYEGIRQAANDFGRTGYGGPCPPRGHGRHHYRFTLYALNVDHLPLKGSARCRDVEHAAKEHSLAQAELIGLYGR